MRSSRVVNLGRFDPFLYFIMSHGVMYPFLYSLVGADGSGEVPRLGSEVGSSVYFCLYVQAAGWAPSIRFFLVNCHGYPPRC